MEIQLSAAALDAIAERVVRAIRSEAGAAGGRREWATIEQLAEHVGWGVSTVRKLSAAKQIGGMTVHGGKVRFNLPKFDQWLLTEHLEGPPLPSQT